MEPFIAVVSPREMGEGNGMIFDELVIIVLGAAGFLILLERLCHEWRSNWKRRAILRRDDHTEKVLFALNEGQTIVGVKEEHNTLCFYVANHSKDEKGYE